MLYFSRRTVRFSALLFLCLTAQAIIASPGFASTQIYTYTDDAGVQNFTNEFDSIPEQYRGRIAPREFDAPPTVPIAAASVPPAATPGPIRAVTGTAEYHMGDHDTRADAVRLAVEAAKKDALEQVATYVERITEVSQMDVTRDDIRSFTAGIVKVTDRKITSRLEQDTIVIRADLTAEIDEQEVVQAIVALRENENARHELMALRAETDQLQQQLDAANQALAGASTAEEVQQFTRQRQDMFDELQANALMSQAWTSWAYPTVGFYSYPFIAVPGINGLLSQARPLTPRHRHVPLAHQPITAQPGSVPRAQAPPLLNQQGRPARVGDVVVIPTPRFVPPMVRQFAPQSQPYQVHPNHFWRPSPPNIQSAPSVPQHSPSVSMAPRSSGSYGGYSGGGRSHSGGGHRGR